MCKTSVQAACPQYERALRDLRLPAGATAFRLPDVVARSLAQGRVTYLFTPLHFLAAMGLVAEELAMFEGVATDLRGDECLEAEAAAPAPGGLMVRQYSGEQLANAWLLLRQLRSSRACCSLR